MTDSPKPARHRTSFGYADSLGALGGGSIGHLHERDPTAGAYTLNQPGAPVWYARLALAMIEQALADLDLATADAGHKDTQAALDAARWFRSDEAGALKFATFCDVFGLDASAVRQKVLGAKREPHRRRRARPATVPARVLEVMDLEPEREFHVGDIAERVDARRDRIGEALRDLEAGGRIKRVGYGCYRRTLCEMGRDAATLAAR